MNGDVLTTLDYGDLLRAHRASGNMLTIATHERTVSIDYGVLHFGTRARPCPRSAATTRSPSSRWP